MEPDPSIWGLLFTFLLGGVVAIVRMSLVVLPVIGVGIWAVSRVRRLRGRSR